MTGKNSVIFQGLWVILVIWVLAGGEGLIDQGEVGVLGRDPESVFAAAARAKISKCMKDNGLGGCVLFRAVKDRIVGDDDLLLTHGTGISSVTEERRQRISGLTRIVRSWLSYLHRHQWMLPLLPCPWIA